MEYQNKKMEIKYVFVDNIEEFINDLLNELCKSDIDYVCIKEYILSTLLYYELHIKNTIYRISDKIFNVKEIVDNQEITNTLINNQSNINLTTNLKQSDGYKKYTKQMRKSDNNKYKVNTKGK